MKGTPIILFALVSTFVNAATSFTTVITFGDSISDNGNYLASFGYPKSPYWKGRYSIGPVWSEYLASFLTQTSTLSSSSTLKSFASLSTLSLSSFATLANSSSTLTAFATSISSTVSKTNNTVFRNYADAGALATVLDAQTKSQKTIPDLASQYANFTNSSPNLNYTTTLFTVYAGINDIGYPLAVGAMPNPTYIVGNISTLITNLISLGAKNIMINNIYPIESCPTATANNTLQALYAYYVNDSTMGFNALLKAKVYTLQAAYPSVTLTYNDFHAFGTYVMSTAGQSTFSFKDVSDECYTGSGTSYCSTPTNYFFWDYLHPTTKMHLLFAGYAYYNLMVLSNWAAASL